MSGVNPLPLHQRTPNNGSPLPSGEAPSSSLKKILTAILTTIYHGDYHGVFIQSQQAEHQGGVQHMVAVPFGPMVAWACRPLLPHG